MADSKKILYQPGDRVGPSAAYTVVRFLGAGGMGEVLEVLDHPNGGWNDADRACFEARKAYFASLRTIFQDNQIKTLSRARSERTRPSSVAWARSSV